MFIVLIRGLIWCGVALQELITLQTGSSGTRRWSYPSALGGRGAVGWLGGWVGGGMGGGGGGWGGRWGAHLTPFADGPEYNAIHKHTQTSPHTAPPLPPTPKGVGKPLPPHLPPFKYLKPQTGSDARVPLFTCTRMHALKTQEGGRCPRPIFYMHADARAQRVGCPRPIIYMHAGARPLID